MVRCFSRMIAFLSWRVRPWLVLTLRISASSWLRRRWTSAWCWDRVPSHSSSHSKVTRRSSITMPCTSLIILNTSEKQGCVSQSSHTQIYHHTLNSTKHAAHSKEKGMCQSRPYLHTFQSTTISWTPLITLSTSHKGACASHTSTSIHSIILPFLELLSPSHKGVCVSHTLINVHSHLPSYPDFTDHSIHIAQRGLYQSSVCATDMTVHWCTDVYLCRVWQKHLCTYFVTLSPLLLHDLVKCSQLLRKSLRK